MTPQFFMNKFQSEREKVNHRKMKLTNKDT